MELSQNVPCSEDQVAQKASFLQALEWGSEGWTKTPHSYEDFLDKDNQLIDEEAKNKYIEKLPQFHLLVFRNKLKKKSGVDFWFLLFFDKYQHCCWPVSLSLDLSGLQFLQNELADT